MRCIYGVLVGYHRVRIMWVETFRAGLYSYPLYVRDFCLVSATVIRIHVSGSFVVRSFAGHRILDLSP